ncbi:hypothetical protein DW830_09725 [Prevotella sp. AM34-19LB]|nr:hypothetical protein DW830_09725 [Prevotella sp. AM34-19LB]
MEIDFYFYGKKMNDMINYLTIEKRLLVAMLAFILPFSFVKAEVKEDGKAISHGWYVGIEGGMPFGFSTFSSFGHDKTHLGWAAGLYGGYRFTPYSRQSYLPSMEK